MGILKIGDRSFDSDQVVSALVQYKLLESLVGQVVLDKVVEEIPLTEQEVFYALVGATDAEIPEDFRAFLAQWCQQKSVTPEYFSAVMLRDLRIEKFKEICFGNQVESEFLRNKLDFDQVEYSLIQMTDLLLAQEVYFQLRDDGASFEQLAQQHSLGSERVSGGWVGPVALSSLPVEVAMLFRSGQPQAIYGPIPIGDCFWIVRLEHLTSARLTEATRASLINRLYDRWLQSQVRSVTSTPGAIAIQADASQAPPIASLT
ncbi:MAG: peptidylprolyl isomerase [Oscillatoriophycideae cyanobacterium NC_groundwater_1537_Pr4_S-0.65um_50_18]|nr:peptidylprolyl isomerase [Oscillatoriophycideae cyanobacterium NC_groundwater_1537_Pr4_S-0.65um_50_18]